MKKIIFLFSFFLLFTPIKAQTFHLIMVSDYASPIFGKVSLENETNIEQMFGTVSSYLGYSLTKTYLNTNNKLFNRTEIISKLNNLNTLPEDIVVFYYNGFGIYPPQSKSEYPTFTLANTDNKTLSVDDISTQLSLKNNRLGMVIADIRNTENRQLSEMPSGAIIAAEQLSKVITEKIFLEHSGVYKILSSKKGMPSYPYFTISFVDAFFGTLEISESEYIKNMSLGYVLSETQSIVKDRVSLSEIKTPQEILWSFTKLDKKVKTYQPPYFNIPTPKELKAQISLLVNPINTNERTKIENNVRAFFSSDAIIEVIKAQTDGSKTANSSQKMNVYQYIKQTAGYNTKVKRTIEDFNVFDFRRTADFKKFSELRITEKIN